MFLSDEPLSDKEEERGGESERRRMKEAGKEGEREKKGKFSFAGSFLKCA